MYLFTCYISVKKWFIFIPNILLYQKKQVHFAIFCKGYRYCSMWLLANRCWNYKQKMIKDENSIVQSGSMIVSLPSMLPQLFSFNNLHLHTNRWENEILLNLNVQYINNCFFFFSFIQHSYCTWSWKQLNAQWSNSIDYWRYKNW